MEAQSGVHPRARLPITIDIMQKLKEARLTTPLNPDNVMLWAVACAGFFGFLWAGEFSVPSAEAYDPEAHLNLSDLALDNHNDPTVARLQIKQSKTDPFRQGVEVFLGKTDSAICPIQAIILYICVRSPNPGQLFILTSGVPLTRTFLVKNLQTAFGKVGLDDAQYNGHSFRIGAATMAAQ